MSQSKHGMKRTSPSSCDTNEGEPPLYLSSFSELTAAHQRLNHQSGLFLSPKSASFQEANLSHGETQPARDFIDAWSTAERGGDSDLNEVCNSECPLSVSVSSISSKGKLPLSSLTLSMCGGSGSNEDGSSNLHGESMEADQREINGGCFFKSQPLLSWMSPVPCPWMTSPPGGPLAEALCLGMASTVKPPPPPPNVGGSSSTTTTSSGSKSSCGGGDGNQGLKFD